MSIYRTLSERPELYRTPRTLKEAGIRFEPGDGLDGARGIFRWGIAALVVGLVAWAVWG